MSSSPLLHSALDNYRSLVGFVARRMGDRQEAHDLVHDAWVRAAESQPTLSQELHTPSSRAYLYAVAENLVIDHYRRRKRQQDALQGVALWQPAQTDDVKDAHSLRQAIAAVDQALADLPPRCRAIFLADRLDGTPQADIAAQHGTSVKTVEREVQRAMDAIEQALHRWRGDPAPAIRKGRRRALGALLSLAGIGVGGSSAWLAWRQWVPSWQLTLSAAQHQPLQQALPDGSSLALDAQGLADVAFYAHRRHVQLHRGTAFFNVQRDAQRAFIVDAGSARITVLGTRFEVALEDAHTVRVTVEQGHVQVAQRDGAAEPQAVELHDGETLRWTAGHAPQRSHPGGEVATWRNGWLELDNLPLEAAIQRISRYCAQPVRVEPSAAQLRVFGRVQISHAADWVQLLPAMLPVQLRAEQAHGQAWIVITRS